MNVAKLLPTTARSLEYIVGPVPSEPPGNVTLYVMPSPRRKTAVSAEPGTPALQFVGVVNCPLEAVQLVVIAGASDGATAKAKNAVTAAAVCRGRARAAREVGASIAEPSEVTRPTHCRGRKE